VLLWVTKLLHGLVIVYVMSDQRTLSHTEASYCMEDFKRAKLKVLTRKSVFNVKALEGTGLLFRRSDKNRQQRTAIEYLLMCCSCVQ